MTDTYYGINQYRYDSTTNYLNSINCDLTYIQLNNSSYRDIAITPENNILFNNSGKYYLEFKIPRNKIYDINLDLKLMYKDTSNFLSGLNETRYEQIQRLLIPKTSAVNNITAIIYEAQEEVEIQGETQTQTKTHAGILRNDEADCNIFDVYRTPMNYYITKTINGNSYGATYGTNILDDYVVTESYSYNTDTLKYNEAVWEINNEQYKESEINFNNENDPISVIEKHALEELTIKNYTTTEYVLSENNRETKNINWSINNVTINEGNYIISKIFDEDKVNIIESEDQENPTEYTILIEEGLDEILLIVNENNLTKNENEETYTFTKTYSQDEITINYKYEITRNNIEISTDDIEEIEDQPGQYKVVIEYSQEDNVEFKKVKERIYWVEKTNNDIDNKNVYSESEVEIIKNGELISYNAPKVGITYSFLDITINYQYFYKFTQDSFNNSFKPLPIENLVIREILASFLADNEATEEEKYYTVKIVFSPKTEKIDFNTIVLEIVRRAYDEDISYTSESRVYKGLYLDKDEIIENLHLYQITELLNDDIIPHKPLTHIGVWSHPELILAINGEHIQIGQSGFYELNNYNINSLGIVAKQPTEQDPNINDKFVIDYQYEID